MAGDYTRFSFDATQTYSGVHQQQGRVSLDAEFNEFEEILDRRSRSEMFDTVGQAVVPLTTPHGFEIGIDGTGALTIGIGRLYVDGVQAECFGDLSNPAATVRDDLVGGIVGSGPVGYAAQPFVYQPGYPALSAAAGDINLVYLDVWQREVTVFEDDGLREIALNGPDTATRVQTAWQVKVLQGADAGSCVTPPATWTTLTAASTARLTAATAPVAPAPGPCVINPAGGFTGLENRLYRVEVHRAGTLGGGGGSPQASFKWSRDNASLAARVLSIGPGVVLGQSIIAVASTGRDAWMRFEPGHHVELLDDQVEYAMCERGVGGALARVVTVNHATGEVHVDQNFTTFAVVPARHPRLRRWDNASAAEPLERNASIGPALALEDGISVAFGGAGTDTLHAGDHWVFAARTADGSIDPLVNAPPRGILHHFARLALVTSGAPATLLSDCRLFWPRDGGGCCTVVVRPGQSIQAAIDSLPPTIGGCVCLRAGTHTITAPIAIHRSNITLHGESGGTVVRYDALGALDIAGTATARVSAIHVHDISFQMGSNVFGVAVGVSITYATGVRIDHCGVGATGLDTGTLVGVYVANSRAIDLRDNSIGTFFYGLWVETLDGLFVARNNFIAGHVYRLTTTTLSMGIAGILARPLAGAANARCLLEGNRFDDFSTAIELRPGLSGSAVRGNRVVRNGPGEAAGTMPIDRDALRTYADDQRYGIEIETADCSVDGNELALPNAVWGGIRVRAPRVQVRGNQLPVPATVPAGQLQSVGVYATVAAVSANPGADDCLIDGNRFDGAQVAILVSRAARALVRGNVVQAVQIPGYVGVYADDLTAAKIAHNQIGGTFSGCVLLDGDGNVCTGNDLVGCGFGFFALNEADGEFHDNTVTGAPICGIALGPRRGATRVTANRVQHCAWLPPPGQTAVSAAIVAVNPDIATWTADWHLTIDGCDVLDSGISPDGSTVASTASVGIGAAASAAAITRNRIHCSQPALLDPALEHRALALMGPLAVQYSVGNQLVIVATGTALITDNVVNGPGAVHLVELTHLPIGTLYDFVFDRVVFSNNQCEHVSAPALDRAVTVRLRGNELTAIGNQVRSPSGVYSLHMANRPRATLMGNVCNGGYRGIDPGLRPIPILNFNF